MVGFPQESFVIIELHNKMGKLSKDWDKDNMNSLMHNTELL